MTRDEAKKLLGGYATGTLTRAEQQALFAAALEDQELFDALSGEQALRDLLSDPAARAAVLAALDEPRRGWFQRAAHWMMRPAGVGIAVASIAAIVGYGVWQARNHPAAAPVLLAENPAAEKTAAPAPQPEPIREPEGVKEAPAKPAAHEEPQPAPKRHVAMTRAGGGGGSATAPASPAPAAPPPALPPSPPAGTLAEQQPVPAQQVTQQARLQQAEPPPPPVPARPAATPMFQTAQAQPPAATQADAVTTGALEKKAVTAPRVAWAAYRRAEDGSLTPIDVQSIHAGDTIVVRLTPPLDGFLSVARSTPPQQILLPNQRAERAKPIDLAPLTMSEPGSIQLSIRFVPPVGSGVYGLAGVSAKRSVPAAPQTETIALVFQ